MRVKINSAVRPQGSRDVTNVDVEDAVSVGARSEYDASHHDEGEKALHGCVLSLVGSVRKR